MSLPLCLHCLQAVLADLHGLKVKPQLADDAALPFLLQNEQPDGATSCSGGHSSS
ncbi:hypothetical protein SEVIR_8G031150v4 [Setaria viridis]|uniref:Uncharacterized protein n=1 Tax=Setaria viridis TaxID=4556 RepID=A0A4U6TB68_SETVI|nr:hypothetical protein SEVIR_8G031150v2 [Setaria viridis]